MSSPGLDLEAYLQRIEHSGDRHPNLAVLRALHLAHATHIPFENLDILLGRPIPLDLESLQKKFVADGRGGYCFEQNLLFAAALEALGFSVRRLAARVRYRNPNVMPRTHMTLLVEADGGTWLADVGFGAEGLLFPVPFGTEQPIEHFAWTYRVIEDGDAWVLQSLHDGVWLDLYAFTLEPQLQVDYELANYFTSTHPKSRFVLTLTAQLPTPEGRWFLRNYELVRTGADKTTTRLLATNDELLAVLAENFKLRFPAGTRFNFQGAHA